MDTTDYSESSSLRRLLPQSPSESNMPDNLLRNFITANLNVLPILARVVKSVDGSSKSEPTSDNEYIYYNTLLHHRIQKGSLLVLHKPTRQVKVLARCAEDWRCFAVPSTYQGLFRIERKQFKTIEDLLAWSTVTCSTHYDKFLAPKSDKVKIVAIGNVRGNLLKSGDRIRVKTVPMDPQAKTVNQNDETTDEEKRIPNNEHAFMSRFYRRLGFVEVEKLDAANKSIGIHLPFDLKATFEEVIDTEEDRVTWTMGELIPLLQKQRINVRLIKAGNDHPTDDENLPKNSLLEFVQVIAEPSVWVSDQIPESPAFHLPIRMEICLKLVKQLSKESSPLLTDKQRVLSLLDRCVEHLPVHIFKDILVRRYDVETILKPSAINYQRSRAKSSAVQLRNYREISGHNANRNSTQIRHSAPYDTRLVTLAPVRPSRKERFTSPVMPSGSSAEHAMINSSHSAKYRVANRSSSGPNTKRAPQPVYLLSAKSKPMRATKNPNIFLTPPTPAVVNTMDSPQYFKEVLGPQDGSDDSDHATSVVVGKRMKQFNDDFDTKQQLQSKETTVSFGSGSCSTVNDEVFAYCGLQQAKVQNPEGVQYPPSRAKLHGRSSRDLFIDTSGPDQRDQSIMSSSNVAINSRSFQNEQTADTPRTIIEKSRMFPNFEGYGDKMGGSQLEILNLGFSNHDSLNSGKFPFNRNSPMMIPYENGIVSQSSITSNSYRSGIGPKRTIKHISDDFVPIKHTTIINTFSLDHDRSSPFPRCVSTGDSFLAINTSLNNISLQSGDTQIWSDGDDDRNVSFELSLTPQLQAGNFLNGEVFDDISNQFIGQEMNKNLSEIFRKAGLKLPVDGNLFRWNPEMFSTLLRELCFPEDVIKECRRRAIDGKKFARMSQETLKKLGLEHSLIYYFKERTFRPVPIPIDNSITGGRDIV